MPEFRHQKNKRRKRISIDGGIFELASSLIRQHLNIVPPTELIVIKK